MTRLVWLPIGLLILVAALNAWTDRLQTDGDQILGDRIDLVNSRIDRECR